MDYTNYKKQTYNPKKAVKSFTDLEVYQKALEAGVFAANIIFKAFKHPAADIESAEVEHPAAEVAVPKLSEEQKESAAKGRSNVGGGTNHPRSEQYRDWDIKEYVIKNMIACALNIPHLIAESHSSRFGVGEQCLLILDKAMLNCNKMVVYLEQTRDICKTGLEVEEFEDLIKKYFYIRRKVLNLQRVWRKYIEINKKEK